jgi:hypothetical protein
MKQELTYSLVRIEKKYIPPAFFLFCQRTNGTFAKPHKPFLIPGFAKEPFLTNALHYRLNK